MTIDEMHIYFRQLLNKLLASRYESYTVPEIDFWLNRAQMMLIQMIAYPNSYVQGFEFNQRSIDAIRTIVVYGYNMERELQMEQEQIDAGEYLFIIPDNYLYYIDARAYLSDDICENIMSEVKIRQHEDMFRLDSFASSSIKWKVVNATFDGSWIELQGNYMIFHTLGQFSVDSVELDYIRRPVYMHNALRAEGGSYQDLQGNVLTGQQDCELPEMIHDKLVSLAAFLASVALQMPDASSKLQIVQQQ